MRSRSVWAAPAPPPVRAFNIFLGGGVPALHQTNGLVGPLAPLAPLAGKMAFMRGVEGPGGHPAAAGAAFTGKNLVNDTTAGGPSVDNEVMRFAYPTGKPPTPIDVQGVGYYYKFLDNPSRWVKSWDENGHPKGGLVDNPEEALRDVLRRGAGGACRPRPDGGPRRRRPTRSSRRASSTPSSASTSSTRATPRTSRWRRARRSPITSTPSGSSRAASRARRSSGRRRP